MTRDELRDTEVPPPWPAPMAAGDTTSGRYRYGRVGGALRVVTETTEKPWVCCGYCSAHMAARTARAGLSDRMAREAHAIRAATGRPHNAGSNAAELRAGARAALGVELRSVARSDIRDRLAAGYAVVAAVDYAKVPAYLRTQGGAFGHSVCIYGARTDRVGWFDPLWAQGSEGAWVPWPEIAGALWDDGAHSTTTARAAAPAPRPPVRPPAAPPAAPPAEPCNTAGELEAAADHHVAELIDYLEAPAARAADRWDAGEWQTRSILVDPLAADPCEPFGPASWARVLPWCVRDARAALATPAAWGLSAWRAASWAKV